MFNFMLLILILGIAAFIWAAWIEPRRYVIRRYDVQLANLKAPLVAVAIGDLQPNSFHWPAKRLNSVFADVSRNETPDLTFWLGDYYNGHTGASGNYLHKHPKVKAWVEQNFVDMPEIAEAMAQLNGRLGSYAVLGNHDWAWSGEETKAQLESRGIKVLQDDVVDVIDPADGQKIQVLGYEDISSYRTPNYEEAHKLLDDKAAQVALSHSPDAFPHALGGPALMLAGHTHGGQVRIPFYGALVLPIEYPNYDRGWFAERHRRLFVTVGLGTSLPPFRFLSPPEIVVLNLIPALEEE